MRIRTVLFLVVLLFGLSTCSSVLAADTIEQQYATKWNVEPIVRLSIDRSISANAARCRIDEGEYKDGWMNGRVVGTEKGRTIWRIPVDGLKPGTYHVTYDLRTPAGAEWIPGVLRVPQIARNTGLVGRKLSAPEKWPQEQYERIECDSGPVEFAWDRNNLYVRPSKGAPEECGISIDAVPAVPGEYVKKVAVSGVTTVPWSSLFPAGPLTGQTLRYRVDNSSPEWIDLLFVGTGREQFFGATMVSNGPGGDDQGPPPPLLRARVDMSGLDCRSCGVSWGSVESRDPGEGPHHYDWSRLLANADLYKPGLTYCSIGLSNRWADELKKTDPDRYWKLAEDFACEAAKRYASVGVRHFSLGFNEPEMFFRTDKENYFNENLTHLANGVRRGCPDAVVIAGKFSSGDPRLIRDFYAHGFKDNFDVMDIHPYNNDALTGTNMGEVVASHETLVELGMPDKRLFLGEGWGPTRDLKQVVRTKWDASVTEAEADYTRQFYQNGYRSLVSAKADYSPDWVLGAKYFTLNDNVGGTYWKQAARPVCDGKGQVMYYMIGSLRFDDPKAFRAFFCNGGLIDFFGNPKGQWFYDFPPALPEVRILASNGPEYMVEGEWHKIDVTVVNANPRPITDLTLGLRERTAKFDGAISAEAVGDYTMPILRPGGVWRTAIKARVGHGRPGRLRLAAELTYDYDGEAQMSDDVVATEIRKPIDVTVEPSTVVLDQPLQDAKAAVVVRNNCRTEQDCRALDYSSGTLKVIPSKESLHLSPGEERSYTLLITPVQLEPGVREIPLTDRSDVRLRVSSPLNCPRMTAPVKIDGDLSDWPTKLVASGSIRFGATVGKAERPAGDPFPVPPPVKESALEADGNVKPGGNTTEKPKAPVFGANAAAAWDDTGLYLAVMVEDATFRQEYTGSEVWRQDSVQIAFDALDNAKSTTVVLPGGEPLAGYGPDDYEIAVAQTSEGPQISIVCGPKGSPIGVVKDAQLAVKREGKFTTYEARIPWSLLKGVSARQGTRFGFDILINNFEGNDRYTLGWANGICDGKYPSRFVPVVLD